MGIKLRDNVNPLEASIENGCLNIFVFDKVIKSVDLGIPKNIKVERQCNFIKTVFNNVVGYFYNDSFNIIIRRDGTVNVLTNNFILLFQTKININSIFERNMTITKAGSFSIMDVVTPAYIANLDGVCTFLFSDDIAVTILLDMEEELSKYLKDWATTHNDVGTVHIIDNKTQCGKLWVNFGTNDYHMLNNYKCIMSNGFIGGVSK